MLQKNINNARDNYTYGEQGTIMLLIGNYDLCTRESFNSHALRDDEETTYCGLKFSKLKGDWQILDETMLGAVLYCRNCKRIIPAQPLGKEK